MYKGVIQLAKLNSSFMLTFNLVLEGDPVTEEQNRQTGRSGLNDKPVSKFESHGYRIFKAAPHPFLTIDITSSQDKKNGYDAGKRVTINSRGVYYMQKYLKKILNDYEKYGDEWYMQDGRGSLYTPPYVQERYSVTIPCSSGSHIKILPNPVPVDQNGNLGRGFVFCINRIENYCYLSVDDLGYLGYIFDHLNMMELAMHLIETERVYTENEPLVEHVIHNVAYGVQDEPIHEPPMINRRPENMIPSI